MAKSLGRHTRRPGQRWYNSPHKIQSRKADNMAEEEKKVAAEIIEEDAGETAEAAEVMPAIVPANEAEIRGLIYTVRGTQVMLDSDLAMLYGVETRSLNQAVTRHPERFPERFCFRLTREEEEILKSQSVISSEEGWGGRRKPNSVFTETGVSMISAVLRSKTAAAVSVRIMDAFVEMRHFIASNAAMFDQIRAVELRQLEYQKTTDERFERVFDYMETHEAPKQKVFFDGQVYDAFEFLVSLVRKAEKSIALIDGYVGNGTLNILAKKADGVDVTIWTHPRTSLTQLDIDTFNAQYPQLTVERTTAFHDRFLILDNSEGYFVGASLKDAGKKSFAIARIEDAETVIGILTRLQA